MATTHEVTFPIQDPAAILSLRAGDEVTVQGHIIGTRDRTQIRIFDQGVEPPMDLTGAFLLHTAPNVRKLGPGRYEKICIGTTTSARMVRFTEPLGAQYGVRAICGKGGFPDEAIEPMQKLGMVYFAIVGGAAALETTQIEEIEEMFDVGGEFVDIVKFGWGTSYVTNNLEKKIALYRSFDTPVVCGGTLFEVVYARGRMDQFKLWLQEHRFSHVEVSDGTIDIPRDEKLELIADFARDFTVLSEVGSKDPDVVYAPYQWVEWLKEEKEAGAWKVITEAREGGTAGIFRKDGDMRTGLIDEIAHEVEPGNLLFEAPTKSSQAWFVKHFGPNVNLGNIPPEEVIPLETLRLGLRGDTLKEGLLGGAVGSTEAHKSGGAGFAGAGAGEH